MHLTMQRSNIFHYFSLHLTFYSPFTIRISYGTLQPFYNHTKVFAYLRIISMWWVFLSFSLIFAFVRSIHVCPFHLWFWEILPLSSFVPDKKNGFCMQKQALLFSSGVFVYVVVFYSITHTPTHTHPYRVCSLDTRELKRWWNSNNICRRYWEVENIFIVHKSNFQLRWW